MTMHFNAAFAMSFTREEVVLEKRDDEGWKRLGAVRFSTGNMGHQLKVMRASNAAAADGDTTPDTLLVIPDDQVLYTTLSIAPGPEPRRAIARALEGMTPYAVEDLVFDWAPDQNGQADSLRVAAVARRTLIEAERFAAEQGFRPTGFIARPTPEMFPGQPDFGSSAATQTETARSQITMPDLRRAGVTSSSILDAPDDAAMTGPVISRIVPHVLPGTEPSAPAPTNISKERAVVSEFMTPPVREVTAPPALAPKPVAATTTPPTADAEVIRHPSPAAPVVTSTLPPRAQAFHSRAAEARSTRADEPSDDSSAPGIMALLSKLSGRLPSETPSTFTVLMGLLIGALLIIAIFFGGESTTPDTEIASTEDAAPAGTPIPAPVVSEAPVIEDTTEPEGEIDATGPELAALPENIQPAISEQPPVDEAAIDSAVQTALADAQPTPAEATPAQAEPEDTTLADQQAPTPEPSDEATSELAATPEAEPQPAIEPEAEAEAEPAAQPDTTANAAPRPAAPLRTLALSRSARPAPPPSRAAAPEPNDSTPTRPANPQPFAQRAEPAPVRLTGIRPPSRPATPARAPAAPTRTKPAATAPTPAANDRLQRSTRPRARPSDLSFNLPEGSDDGTQHAELTRAEIDFLEDLLKSLRTAELGNDRLSAAERGAVILLAQARPARRPVDVGAATRRAVDRAVQSALEEAPPPSPRPRTNTQRTAASQTATGGLSNSERPARRPNQVAQAAGSGVSEKAVEAAIAAAVNSGPLAPGTRLALASSPLPPRRSKAIGAAAAGAGVASAVATSASSTAAEAAARAAQLREDKELQAQAEARARAHAAADARAEAQARAAAEARARAQAEAEARSAAARKQAYTPPEAENEPEITTRIPKTSSSGTVAAAATIKGGIKTNRTQIIGTIGAGKGSRALVRLSNGKIVTLRLGDKINGGKITDIGNSRVTYVKGGRSKHLAVLDGR